MPQFEVIPVIRTSQLPGEIFDDLEDQGYDLEFEDNLISINWENPGSHEELVEFLIDKCGNIVKAYNHILITNSM